MEEATTEEEPGTHKFVSLHGTNEVIEEHNVSERRVQIALQLRRQRHSLEGTSRGTHREKLRNEPS
jgi:hypothetical protein